MMRASNATVALDITKEQLAAGTLHCELAVDRLTITSRARPSAFTGPVSAPWSTHELRRSAWPFGGVDLESIATKWLFPARGCAAAATAGLRVMQP